MKLEISKISSEGGHDLVDVDQSISLSVFIDFLRGRAHRRSTLRLKVLGRHLVPLRPQSRLLVASKSSYSTSMPIEMVVADPSPALFQLAPNLASRFSARPAFRSQQV
jgi:hypothetical protein